MEIIKNTLVFPRPFEERTSTDLLLLHHAAASVSSMEDIHAWHLAVGRNGFSYNFLVRKDASIHEGRPIWASDADAYGHNFDSLSICFEGDFSKEYMLEPQINAGINLIRWIRKQYPNILIDLHKNVNSDTECPGKNFPAAIIIQGGKNMEITTVQEAVKKLHEKGVMNSPEYWAKAATVVMYLDKLLINMANKLPD